MLGPATCVVAALVIVGVGSLRVADDPITKKAGHKGDAERMAGTWRLAAYVADGINVPAEFLKKARVTIREGKLLIKSPPSPGIDQTGKVSVVYGSDFEAVLELKPAEKHKRLDLLHLEEVTGETVRIPAIYKLDKDEMVICWTMRDGLPGDFTCTAGSQNRLLTLKRAPTPAAGKASER